MKMTKKYLTIAFVISAGVAFGVFSFAPASKTFYIRNEANFLASAIESQSINPADNKIGDLSNNIIPKIKTPKNLTSEFVESLVGDIISKNAKVSNVREESPSEEQALLMPDPEAIAKEFIQSGINQAHKNIVANTEPNLKLSAYNDKESIASYLAEIQAIINNNLKDSGAALLNILVEAEKNDGRGIERLVPIITSYEIAANQIEGKLVPSSLENLMANEVRLLRVTANVLRALINTEADPLGTITAAKQFGLIMKDWQKLQERFDVFIKNLNKT
ncbi:hypothetical protein A2567_03090 [Candidatus Azambacteria bacterium RIFOXYD1_FULL_42_11]|uniref:Uncharacterized protein n=4 Tax=Candidatus Azamiibacteriota TaxID=1752741 RepID=A0A0G0ZCB7_9BACT|nr:MAG: hypothetical protein UV07_C0004G0024 [Candidatus Azambacteria bacterium GW2011_GWB1_42_17]KKS46309.1 MAG: hypothetical protein UV10_C0004G0024 [Candidatus Azambacteria bacterium GW2011_GWA1_42_19]KKS75664.1 MAG: hypothetical protein UV48_C0008G0004 [Candidatus Azambacteria bacterium GW2011_GWA2_42_9]KKS88573.1 MAG: hypothetical protein UV62_C0005G0027 [Parcubacteria group bacterium GW2011_GWC1_43_11]OGD42013.1 MAG: hypothetical protein A2567_03090 [Candidatus Azambacteria bacterium RIFO